MKEKFIKMSREVAQESDEELFFVESRQDQKARFESERQKSYVMLELHLKWKLEQKPELKSGLESFV